MPKKKITVEEAIQPYKPRKFVCSKYPFMRIPGGMRFKAGHLTIESEEKMACLERVPEYQHGQIVEIREKKTPAAKMSIEETAELIALEELKKLEPQARRGAISTANLS